MSADHKECGLRHDEAGELLLPPRLGQQEQGVPALLSQPRLQALREGQDDAAAQAHVPLQENRKLDRRKPLFEPKDIHFGLLLHYECAWIKSTFL